VRLQLFDLAYNVGNFLAKIARLEELVASAA
jgi:hypothetical protein